MGEAVHCITALSLIGEVWGGGGEVESMREREGEKGKEGKRDMEGEGQTEREGGWPGIGE